jgi:RNA polymerase sigma factor (sigma-70 family)
MRPDGDARAYLFGIAWNVLHMHLRRRSRDGIVDPDVDSMAALDPGPSTLAARRREHRKLTEALRQLPIHDQVAMQLHYWGGLPLIEVARILNVPYPSMRGRMGRAKRTLERLLEQLEQTTPLIVSSTDSG